MSHAYVLPPRRRIYLMRHGDVTYFDAGARIDPSAVALNQAGRQQASAAGAAFASAQVQFDRVIASGLPRTVETAQRVLAATGQAIDIETWPELREIEGGRLGAIPADELEAAFLGAFQSSAAEATRFLGGETLGALLDRVLPALARLRDASDWDCVLLVLHGGVNRAILSHALSGGGRAFFGHLAQETGCINALDVGADHHDWVLRTINYVPPAPLLPEVRNTTMELLYAEFLKYRLS
jgi:probable phosphoglycerate mutase